MQSEPSNHSGYEILLPALMQHFFKASKDILLNTTFCCVG